MRAQWMPMQSPPTHFAIMYSLMGNPSNRSRQSQLFENSQSDRSSSAVPPSAAQIKARKLRFKTPLGHYIAQSLEHSWMRYAKRLKRYRQRKTNRHVHDLRIAIRQVTASLDAIKLIIPHTHCHRVRSGLKKQLKILGELRDSHIQLRRLNKFPRLTKGMKKLRHHLQEEKTSWEHAFEKSQNDNDLAHHFAMLIERVELASNSISADKTARRRILHKLQKRFLRVVEMQPRSAIKGRRLHSARIELKQYCYLADVFSDYTHGMNKKVLLRLKRHQEIMGELHDLRLFAKRLKARAAKTGSGVKEFKAITDSLRAQNSLLDKAYGESARRLRALR